MKRTGGRHDPDRCVRARADRIRCVGHHGRRRGAIRVSVQYPAWCGPAPTAIQLAALYDRSAARVARLEAALHACAPLTDEAADMRQQALLPEEDTCEA